jgi:hypothetical protein
MTLELLIYLNLVLLPRLAFTRNDQAIGMATAFKVFVPFVIALFLLFEESAASLVALGMAALAFFWEPLLGARVDMARGYRLAGLVLQVLVPVYVGSFGSGFSFSPVAVAIAGHLAEHLPLLAPVYPGDFYQVCLVLFGLLLLANETNILVRVVFHLLGLEPRRPSSADIDTEEYNAGRAIGILERWLMYLVVLWSDDLSALAFIIAAKGLARFRQLEEKAFAEYMLVGTLLSALAAILVGTFISRL